MHLCVRVCVPTERHFSREKLLQWQPQARPLGTVVWL